MTNESQTDSAEDLLTEVLLAYVESCEAGHCPDREEILRAHPDFREDLEIFFTERDRLNNLGGILRAPLNIDVVAEAPTEIRMPDLLSGCLGDFRLVREVGRGGMATVYEAEQLSLKRRVALKVLPFASALDPRQLQRFQNEASAAAHLRHENIVSVFAVGCERGIHYFAMQFVDGQSLASIIAEKRRLKDHRTVEGTVEMAHASTEPHLRQVSYFDWAAEIGKQAALALEHAHQSGIIHRDIKPANLMLDIDGHLWITDFGLAQFTAQADLTLTGELLGTLRYASPEQLSGRRGSVDYRSDIYSLGATLYELLTLRPPLDSLERNELLQQVALEDPPTLRSLIPEIPEALEMIVLKTLRKDPVNRYASAQDLADDLQRFLERAPVLATPPQYPERFKSWMRRHPVSLLTGFIALSCVTVGALLLAAFVDAERQRTQAAELRANQAYLEERQRAEQAEGRLELAERAINELMVISEDELAIRPELVLIRKRMLRSALSFYEEILVEHSEDPLQQTQVLETRARVQSILQDLEVLRSTTDLFLLYQPVVLNDLAVTETQRPQIQMLIHDAGREFGESLRDIGRIAPSERAKRSLERARRNDQRLNDILTDDQQMRFRQIRIQSEGAAAFRDSEIAVSLGLSVHQRERIQMIEDDTMFGWLRDSRTNEGTASGTERGDSQLAVHALKSVDDRILEVLSSEQATQWRELTGPPLKGLKPPLHRRPPRHRGEAPFRNSNH